MQRRQCPHQHKIQSVITLRLLHHQQVSRRFNHAQQPAVAPRRQAQRTHRLFRKIVALLAVAHPRQRRTQRHRQPFSAGTVPLQQVEGHVLRRARSDTRQAAQRLDQGLQRRWGIHCNYLFLFIF
jgi:hypothetical protein